MGDYSATHVASILLFFSALDPIMSLRRVLTWPIAACWQRGNACAALLPGCCYIRELLRHSTNPSRLQHILGTTNIAYHGL